MYAVVGIVALAGVAGIAMLARFIGKVGGSRTALWVALFALATAVGLLISQVAMIYYRMPVGWIVALAASALVVAALFIGIGRNVSWKAPQILALVGVLILTAVTLAFVLIGAPPGDILIPLFETRAAQIADANGFVALASADSELDTEFGNPVGVSDDNSGVMLAYKGFLLVERKADGPLDIAELEERVAPGEMPIGRVGPGSEIPENAEYSELEVSGGPAVGVAYDAVTEEKPGAGALTDPVRLLVFELDGVEVLMYAQGHLAYQTDGSYEQVAALTFDELIEIAESLEPVK